MPDTGSGYKSLSKAVAKTLANGIKYNHLSYNK